MQSFDINQHITDIIICLATTACMKLDFWEKKQILLLELKMNMWSNTVSAESKIRVSQEISM
jgi:hypothetical protein